MKYSLQSLMIAALVGPPLLAGMVWLLLPGGSKAQPVPNYPVYEVLDNKQHPELMQDFSAPAAIPPKD